MRDARVPLDVMNYNTAFTAEPPMPWPFLLFLGANNFFSTKKTGRVESLKNITDDLGCVVKRSIVLGRKGIFLVMLRVLEYQSFGKVT